MEKNRAIEILENNLKSLEEDIKNYKNAYGSESKELKRFIKNKEELQEAIQTIKGDPDSVKLKNLKSSLYSDSEVIWIQARSESDRNVFIKWFNEKIK